MQSKRRDPRTEPGDVVVKERRRNQQGGEICDLGGKDQNGEPRSILSGLPLLGYSSHRVGRVPNTMVPMVHPEIQKEPM